MRKWSKANYQIHCRAVLSPMQSQYTIEFSSQRSFGNLRRIENGLQ